METISAKELKERSPSLFNKKFEEWQATAACDQWWDSIYEDVTNNPEYYHPLVQDYYKQYPHPMEPEQKAEYERLVELAKEELTHLAVNGFNLYPREILIEFDLNLVPFVRRVGISDYEPVGKLLVEKAINSSWFNGKISASVESKTRHGSGLPDVFNRFELDSEIDDYVTTISGEEYDPFDPTESYTAAYEACFSAAQAVSEEIENHIDELCSDIERCVLDVLEAEYEYQLSEECFLETDVDLDTDEIEEITNEHE